MSWNRFSGYSAGEDPACNLCPNCKHFEYQEDSSHPYKCHRQVSGSGYAASDREHNNPVTGCKGYEKGEPYKDTRGEAILDHSPPPKLVTLLITGLILSVAYALAMIIYGKIKTGLEINTPLILTFVTGIPIGTAAFTLLRLLKNFVNQTASWLLQKSGGKLVGWLIATLLPFVSPVIAFFIMAGVFGAKIM
ncbi:MAG: hypothetical protein Pg6C_17690 [Treponemataceae bacterium]|jgi:hypothetical protein|nr:MAG: hypothetical protein Pg6C_17690 [Treponemataceae bacterium]